MPRGKIVHDTAWSEPTLELYKEAWYLLKESAPPLFERKVESLSSQLRKIITEAEKYKLPYELILSKRAEQRNDYRTNMQRRILIQGKRCAVFTANLPPETMHMWPTAIFKAPKDNWAEILLYILGDDVYVVPRSQMPHATTLDLESRIHDYKNGWCLLERSLPEVKKQFLEFSSAQGQAVRGESEVFRVLLPDRVRLHQTSRQMALSGRAARQP